MPHATPAEQQNQTTINLKPTPFLISAFRRAIENTLADSTVAETTELKTALKRTNKIFPVLIFEVKTGTIPRARLAGSSLDWETKLYCSAGPQRRGGKRTNWKVKEWRGIFIPRP